MFATEKNRFWFPWSFSLVCLSNQRKGDKRLSIWTCLGSRGKSVIKMNAESSIICSWGMLLSFWLQLVSFPTKRETSYKQQRAGRLGGHARGILSSLILDISNWQRISVFLIDEVNDDTERSDSFASNFSAVWKQCFVRCSNIFTRGVKGHWYAVIIWGKKRKEFRIKELRKIHWFQFSCPFFNLP